MVSVCIEMVLVLLELSLGWNGACVVLVLEWCLELCHVLSSFWNGALDFDADVNRRKETK